MKAFSESRSAPAQRAGLILLFDGEVGRGIVAAGKLQSARRRRSSKAAAAIFFDHDEHSQTDILTSGFKPHSRLPDPPYGPVALGMCSLLQWRNRPGFPPGSLTFDCDADGQTVHRFQRTFCF